MACPRARPSKDLDQLIIIAISIADEAGLGGFTVRALAAELGIARMSVYTYVRGLDQLAELMIDQVHGELFGVVGPATFPYLPRRRPTRDPQGVWRRLLRTVADANRDLLLRHSWLAERPGDRPVLGPHSTRTYDVELSTLTEPG